MTTGLQRIVAWLCRARSLSHRVMDTIRRSTGLALALIIALTSVAFGAARGLADAAGKMVICAGHAIVVVYVDENGQPTGTPHFCPDCVLKAMAALGVAGPDVAAALVASRQAQRPDTPALTAVGGVYRPGARAPPA